MVNNYRFFEILPGILVWLTLILMILLSWLLPVWVAVFIILFDIYWFLKTAYLFLHLRTTFAAMNRNLRRDWKKQLAGLRWENFYHLIILPTYDEPYEVIKESIESLIKNNYPKDRYIVALATEERAGPSVYETAKKIEGDFQGVFFKFLVTRHPADLPGEIPGKGSNETWAAKEVQRLIIKPLGIPAENVLVSVFDVDTQVPPDYFNCLAYYFLTSEHPQRSSFQPIPFYTNNIFQAPALARVLSFSSTFWQMMRQSMPEKLVTFSSHSMPLKALEEIGYWQTDVVSEDSRIFWQLYLHYHGDWRVVPLFYPVSMDANAAPGFWKTLSNLYKQQRRWAYGAENIPYLLVGFLKNKAIPLKSKIFWSWQIITGFHSWATYSIIIFALGWLPILLGGQFFNITLLSQNLPAVTSWIMSFTSLGIVSSAILSVALLPPKPTWFRWHHYLLYLLQWALLPITLIIFGCVPAIEAQTRLMLGGKFRLGFWVTPKTRGLEARS